MSQATGIFSIRHLSEQDRERHLARYEFLAEFVMHAPDCASTEKQRELWRRIQVLRNCLGLDAVDAALPKTLSTGEALTI